MLAVSKVIDADPVVEAMGERECGPWLVATLQTANMAVLLDHVILLARRHHARNATVRELGDQHVADAHLLGVDDDFAFGIDGQ